MSTINSNGLSEYLEKLSGTTYKKLYRQPSTAFAIFRRMLPHLAKTIVMGCLYMPDDFLLSDLDMWVKPAAKRQKDQALAILQSLHIMTLQPTRDGSQALQIGPYFKASLRMALEGGGDQNSFGVLSELPVASSIDIPFLDGYARRKWDDILHFVVNSVSYSEGSEVPTDKVKGPKASVKDLLLAGRLIDRKGAGGAINITQAGFTFLLQEPNSQVWTLLLLWLEAAEHARAANAKQGTSPEDMLSFLFLLATLELGRAYSTDALTEDRRYLLPALIDFGLVFMVPQNHKQFFPTRLATTLTSSESSSRSVSAGFQAVTERGVGGEGNEKNAIILETNFRVYAYTSSPLQIAVLALFCDLRVRFKELVSGKLTRKSIRRAVDMGITSDQMVSYLASHAHEQMHRTAAATQKPLLPPVIVDQIRLWQLDTERIQSQVGYLMKEFSDYKEYNDMVTYASDIGILTWRNDRTGVFFVNNVNPMVAYMKNRKKTKKDAA